MNSTRKIIRLIVFAVFLVSMLTLVACNKECEHAYTDNIVAATCTTEGYTEHICTKCGDSYNDSHTAMSSHRFNGAGCVYCSFVAPMDPITPDTEWYEENKVVFTISTKEQLAGLGSLVNQGVNFYDSIVYLDSDIDLEYAPWTPIGNADNVFAGNFVGNGHVIRHLNISSTVSYVGLFGNIAGELSGFTVDNASVFVNGANNYIGVACGYASKTISEVKVDGYVDAKDSSNVGGIVGATVYEITFSESATDVHGLDNVGGIAGSALVSTTVFKGLVNRGNVTGALYNGGLFGLLDGSNSVIYIDNSQNYGNVNGKAYVGGIAGSVAGKVSSIVQSSSNSAVISGEYYVGGIVGRAITVAVSNCSNEGSKISASSCVLEGDVYYAYVGGYVGFGYTVDHCVNGADIEYLARGAYVGGVAGYLSHGVSECSNSGNITGYDFVGGIAGYVATYDASNVIKLINAGNITGQSKVGGIVGQWAYSAALAFGESSNSGAIKGTSYVGGIAGSVDYTTSAIFSAYNLGNTGDVTGIEFCVGGIFGYVRGKDSSVVSNGSVSANISGLYLVGGLIGKAEYVFLSDCKNYGSTVTATGFIIEGEATNAYLGGFVGYGYKVSGCTNTVDINYTSIGSCVGGIVGYATSEVHSCVNNASVKSGASMVGGIAGQLYSGVATTYSDLVNNGAVSGSSIVGGIVGYIYEMVSQEGTYSDKHNCYVITTVSDITNTGSVKATDKVGGIIGYIHVQNDWYGAWYDCCSYWSKCGHFGHIMIAATKFTNSCNVSGTSNAGEMIGGIYSDHPSTLDNYTITGKITIAGTEVSGVYDVGLIHSNSLTLTNRVSPDVEEGLTES